MNIPINVGIIGFSLHEQEKFTHIFAASQDRSRSYCLTELTQSKPVEILIVKIATESALQKLEAYRLQHPDVVVVTAGKAPLDGFPYHIQGVLIISRVLKVLDEINLPATRRIEDTSGLQILVDSEGVDIGGQYDILVVNPDEQLRKTLKEELACSEIPLNIDFAIDSQQATEKISYKYYDFLFVDAKTPDFEKIEQSLKAGSKPEVRSAVVMPTSAESAIEEAHIVMRVLKAFAHADDMADEGYSHELASTEHYNVLVVDDSELMHKSLQIELEKSDIPLQVEYAFSGEEALGKISNKYYDFIFLDVMMPGIDGFETCSRIRKIKSMGKLPIIMLTSKTSPLDEVKGIMAGCTTYLTKPIDPLEFQKMLTRIMRWLKDFKRES